MKFRSDVYNNIFHPVEDKPLAQAEVVKPEPKKLEPVEEPEPEPVEEPEPEPIEEPQDVIETEENNG